MFPLKNNCPYLGALEERVLVHPTILFLEDDEEVRDDLSLLLGSNGYQILMAENENEAVEVLDHASEEVALILINQKMTSEEALAVGRRLRKHPRAGKSAPVVILPIEFDSELEGTNEKVGRGDYKAFINNSQQLQEFLDQLLAIKRD